LNDGRDQVVRRTPQAFVAKIVEYKLSVVHTDSSWIGIIGRSICSPNSPTNAAGPTYSQFIECRGILPCF